MKSPRHHGIEAWAAAVGHLGCGKSLRRDPGAGRWGWDWRGWSPANQLENLWYFCRFGWFKHVIICYHMLSGMWVAYAPWFFLAYAPWFFLAYAPWHLLLFLKCYEFSCNGGSHSFLACAPWRPLRSIWGRFCTFPICCCLAWCERLDISCKCASKYDLYEVTSVMLSMLGRSISLTSLPRPFACCFETPSSITFDAML